MSRTTNAIQIRPAGMTLDRALEIAQDVYWSKHPELTAGWRESAHGQARKLDENASPRFIKAGPHSQRVNSGQPSGRKLEPELRARLQKLIAEKLSSAEIALRLGVSSRTVERHRSHPTAGKPAPRYDRAMILQRTADGNAAGKSDLIIAAAVGCSEQTIRTARGSLGLPPAGRKGRPKKAA